MCRILIYFLPILLGTWGLYVVGEETFLNAVFNSILMYFFAYNETPVNIYVELARWIAPVITANGFLLVFYAIRDRIVHFLIFCTGKSIAVYGPEDEKNMFFEKSNKYMISGKDDFINASKYILLNSESDNFRFYTTHKSRLNKAQVYLKCHSLPSDAVSDSNLHLFCPEETFSRLFWKEEFIYPLAVTKDFQLNIVFLGFDKIGEELLIFGLQNNIFSPEQKITYHIFGDGSNFEAIHTELHSISDLIIFYESPWYMYQELLETADMVIVLNQENQTELLCELLFTTHRDCIHVFAANTESIHLLSGKERLRIFDWKSKAQSPKFIIGDTLFQLAKHINLRYAHLYTGVPETKESLEAEWNKLDTFTRYSNISSADYHEMRLKILEYTCVDYSTDLPKEVLEMHSELEHIRWCRYHYLNNWKYGIPENGKNKDKRLRIHKDLVSYEELTDGEKEKDRENIRLLLSLKSR